MTALLALGALYLLTRPKAGAQQAGVSAGGNGSAPVVTTTASSGKGGGGKGGFTVTDGINIVKDGKTVVAALTTAGLTVPVAAAAVVFEAAGAGLGYEQDGPVGAVVGALNPVTGNAVLFGANAGHALARDAGLNEPATTVATVSGGVLGGIVTLADLLTAAALLPTIGIAIGVAEILGAIFGSPVDTDPPPATVAQFVDFTRGVAAGQFSAFVGEDRIEAAAQILAWANGPSFININPGYGPPIQITNPYQNPARIAAAQLGLDWRALAH